MKGALHKYMKRKQQGLYLKRVLVIIMMTGYIALLALLLVISWYLIAEFQADNHQRERGALEAFISKTEDSMHDIDINVYDVYAYNTNFHVLSGLPTELDTYQNVYELSETLKSKILIDENTHGYFLFYDRLSQSRYSINRDILPADQPAQINAYLKRQAGVSGTMRNWTVFTIGEDTILSVTCARDNVSLSAIHSLGNVRDALQASLDKDLEVVLINDGITIQGEHLEKEYSLRNLIDDHQDSFSTIIQNKQVHAVRLEKTNLWVCALIPYGFWDIMNVPQLFLLMITFVSIFAVLALYRFLRREFLQPLRELTGIMNQIRKGEASKVPDIHANFMELREVNETLSAMVTQIEKQKLLVYEEIIETQRAKMQYLQLQLKPHFYLNGLKTLNALAATGENARMQEFIFSLSDHLRYLLQVENELVPLYKEIAFCKNYIALQSQMHGRKIHSDFHIDKLTEMWMVPTLCIQTFMENSIKYARLGSAKVPLFISISADILTADNGRFLDIVIKDNGQGYPAELLAVLNEKPQGRTDNVGINNLKRRGEILYGDRMEYSFSTHDGAVSELIIPEEANEK